MAAYLERVSVEPRVREIELDVYVMMDVESVDKTCVIWICDCTRDRAAYIFLEGIKPPSFCLEIKWGAGDGYLQHGEFGVLYIFLVYDYVVIVRGSAPSHLVGGSIYRYRINYFSNHVILPFFEVM